MKKERKQKKHRNTAINTKGTKATENKKQKQKTTTENKPTHKAQQATVTSKKRHKTTHTIQKSATTRDVQA